jgi:hypothetical protein
MSPNGLKRDSKWPMSPRSSIGCVQKMICEPMSRLAQPMHLYCTNTNIASKSILEPIVPSAQTFTYLASRLTLSPNGLKRASTWASSPRSTIGCVQNDFWAYGTFGANRAPILCQDWHYLQMDRNEHPFEPHHQGVPSGASKMISSTMVCLAQTVHLSSTDTNTVSKWTEMRFHMTNVT